MFKESELIEALKAPGKVDVTGASGTRNLHDNLSDLRAQVAANQKVFYNRRFLFLYSFIHVSLFQGIGLVGELIDYYGLQVVQQYMSYVRQNAEAAVRTLLKDVAIKSTPVLEAQDFMDDGTVIQLRVRIDPCEGSAVFDFT